MDDFSVMDLFEQLTTADNASPDIISHALERAMRESDQLPADSVAPLTDVDGEPFAMVT